MAELFLKQGESARAVAIYRKLAAERPGDPEVCRRLAEIEAQIASPGGLMSFSEHVQRIVNSVPGAIAGVVMGFDGIPIDTYEKQPGQVDITTLLTEYSSAAQQLRRAADALMTTGEITEVAICGEKLTALMRPLTPEIFLGVVLGPGALTGKARYMMRMAAPPLLKELA